MADYNDDIERYLFGKMTAKERHALEKKALSDPFLADALEGANFVAPKQFSKDIEELNRKIDKSKNTEWFTPLRIAAGVVLILGAGTLFFLLDFTDQNNLALQKEEKATPAFSDSLALSKKDSSDSLLTLATEEKAERKQEPPKRSSSKDVEAADEIITLDKVSSASAGAAAKTQPTELKQEAEADKTVVNEKPIVKEELAEEQKLAVTIQPAPANELSDDAKKKDTYAERKSKSVASAEYARDAESKDAGIVSGNVIALDDGKPLPGVNVVLKGTNIGTVTDGNGNFQLNTENKKGLLVFSFIGMETVEEKIPSDGFVNMKLKEDAAQLSEVVVTGLGIKSDDQREPIIKEAAPVGGLRAYNKYLEKSMRYPAEALAKKIKGKVMIEFTVGLRGDLSDFNVLRGLGYGCDEEVIRLVKEGPKWSPTTQDDVAVETQVKVRVKFDPEKAER